MLVWIHGGGWALRCIVRTHLIVIHSYLAGQASSYTGQDIIKESDFGVVTVIIQYRLGVFGFLPGSEVKANGALNAGLRE